MTNINLIRTFDSQGYCATAIPIPEPTIRRVTIKFGPNTGTQREEIDDPLWGIISLARNKFRNLKIDDGFSGQIPSQLIQSIRDVLGEYWYKVLLERKRLGPKGLNFTATLDMNLGNISNAQTIFGEVGRSVGKIIVGGTTHADKDTPTRVLVGKTTPIIRMMSEFDPTKTPRRGRRIDGVFVPELARY